MTTRSGALTVMSVHAPQRMPRRLVVSIHDVAPPFEPQVRAEIEMLAAIGVRQLVLKVVPNWHGEYPLSAATSFADLLRAQADVGSELVLHGWQHRPSGPLRGQALARLRACLFAGGAAEFQALTAEGARQAVVAGLEMLARAGLPTPKAFCAPGWLWSPEASVGVREAGMRWLIGQFSLHDLHYGRRYWVPSFGHMGAAAPHEAGVRILNWMIAHATAPQIGVLRAYLHPQGDLAGRALRQTLHRIQRLTASEGWELSTFSQILSDLEPGTSPRSGQQHIAQP